VRCFNTTGLLWTECKALYNAGLRVYMLDNYNWIDFVVLSVYLSSYVLRILVQQHIRIADRFYNGTALAREALLQKDVSMYENIRDKIFRDAEQPAYSYFMKACSYSTLQFVVHCVSEKNAPTLKRYSSKLSGSINFMSFDRNI